MPALFGLSFLFSAHLLLPRGISREEEQKVFADWYGDESVAEDDGDMDGNAFVEATQQTRSSTPRSSHATGQIAASTTVTQSEEPEVPSEQIEATLRSVVNDVYDVSSNEKTSASGEGSGKLKLRLSSAADDAMKEIFKNTRQRLKALKVPTWQARHIRNEILSEIPAEKGGYGGIPIPDLQGTDGPDEEKKLETALDGLLSLRGQIVKRREHFQLERSSRTGQRVPKSRISDDSEFPYKDLMFSALALTARELYKESQIAAQEDTLHRIDTAGAESRHVVDEIYTDLGRNWSRLIEILALSDYIAAMESYVLFKSKPNPKVNTNTR
ncbi:unnamed protein product [Amoebophrya sp. A25]|nr:unnamed protein product [Amoebophrya sp. A25]|eukprot:GSA25T00007292001.1